MQKEKTAEQKINNIAKGIIVKFKSTCFLHKDKAIEDYQKDIENFLSFPNDYNFKKNKTSAHKELSEMLVDGYKNIDSSIKKQFKKEFFKDVEKRCPMCGQLLESSGKADSDVPTADLDHFFSKNEYPQFALLPQNLIPTCMECNRIEKHIKTITPSEFKTALKKLRLLKDFERHPHSHFKIYKALMLNLNCEDIIKYEIPEIKKLIDLYGLNERYNNIKIKCYNVLFNIIKNSDIRSPESLERLLENMASANWHETNDGYSLNNSPQIWREFIEYILYDEDNLLALWEEVKDYSFQCSTFTY